MRSKRLATCSLVLLSAVALCAAGSAGPGTPSDVAKAYLKHLETGTPYAAIGELFDGGDFLKRVLGAEFDRLPASERVYLMEMVQVSFKAAVGISPEIAEILKTAKVAEPVVQTISPTEAVAAVNVDYPNGMKHTTEFRMVRKTSGWMIVDLMPTAETLSTQWKDAKEAGVTPVEFMEIFTSSMLAKKEKMIDQRMAALQRAEKDAALRRAQADSDRAQAELQKFGDAQKKAGKATTKKK